MRWPRRGLRAVRCYLGLGQARLSPCRSFPPRHELPFRCSRPASIPMPSTLTSLKQARRAADAAAKVADAGKGMGAARVTGVGAVGMDAGAARVTGVATTDTAARGAGTAVAVITADMAGAATVLG